MTDSDEEILSQNILSDERLDEFIALPIDRKLTMIYLTLNQLSFDVDSLKHEFERQFNSQKS